MQQVVSITSQGQVTLPVSIRRAFGITGATKAIVERVDDGIIVRPKQTFWALGGSLGGNIKLTDKELKEAREEFAKSWAQNG